MTTDVRVVALPPYGPTPDGRVLAPNDGSQEWLTAPSHDQPANRGVVIDWPAGAARQLSQSLRIREGSWVITAETLDGAGVPATGGADGFQLLLRLGCGRGVVTETVQVPGHGVAFVRNADFIEIGVSVPLTAGVTRKAVVFARKATVPPCEYNKATTALANALVVVPQFATKVQYQGTPADTLQPLTAGGVPLSPPLTVPASGVLDLQLSAFTELLQLASAATSQLAWGCRA